MLGAALPVRSRVVKELGRPAFDACREMMEAFERRYPWDWAADIGELPPKPEWARALKNLATPTVLQGNESGSRACKWTAADGHDSCRSIDFGSVAC